jgi:RNA 2',3'-cyclic 3'-phosphodiesterase
MRIFVALDIPDDLRSRVTEYVERVRGLAPHARWVKPESLHVTLKFVGEVTDVLLQEIKERLKTVKASPFQVIVAGVGYFPAPRTARVFWAGVHPTESLSQLASGIDQELAKLAIQPEISVYHPHLTLARVGSGRGTKLPFRSLQRQLDAEQTVHFGTMTAHEFFLYQSKLSQQGAQYARLECFSLE